MDVIMSFLTVMAWIGGIFGVILAILGILLFYWYEFTRSGKSQQIHDMVHGFTRNFSTVFWRGVFLAVPCWAWVVVVWRING